MPLKRENIEKWSPLYRFLKYYVDFALHCYFRITISGKEKINFREPLIFVANHQNALIDDLAILSVHDWQPVFLARSDIFKGRFVTKVLTFFKMLPVYRLRDGFSSLQENETTFRKTLDVLNNRNGLVIMPEGSHLGKRRLRPLKKGIARIAFQAEEASGFCMGIKIIPVGLDFTDYKTAGSPLLIMLGEPIEIGTYLDKYRSNPAQAYNALMHAVANGLKTVMLHIEDEAHHDEVLTLAELAVARKLTNEKTENEDVKSFKIKKICVTELEALKNSSIVDYMKKIESTKSFCTFLQQHKLKPADLQHLKPGTWWFLIQALLLAATFPVFIYTFINLMLPAGLSRWAGGQFEDRHFIASVRLVIGMVAFPVLFLLQTLLVGICTGFSISMFAYFISLPLSVILFYHWRKLFYRSRTNYKLLSMSILRPEKYQKLLFDFDNLTR